jgi:hypothetical protein
LNLSWASPVVLLAPQEDKSERASKQARQSSSPHTRPQAALRARTNVRPSIIMAGPGSTGPASPGTNIMVVMASRAKPVLALGPSARPLGATGRQITVAAAGAVTILSPATRGWSLVQPMTRPAHATAPGRIGTSVGVFVSSPAAHLGPDWPGRAGSWYL